MDLYKYIKYFILGGSATILVNYLVENYKHGPALNSYIYCTPDIYLVIMYIIYKSRGIKGYYTFIIHSLINYTANLLVILLLIFLVKYTNLHIYTTFLLGLLFFIFYSIYYFMYIFKLEFTPHQGR
jgi:hypothetical protein